MKINVTEVRQCLKSFDFKTLFREHLGWDNCQAKLEIPVDGRTIPLSALAQKRGFVAFVCDGSIPDRATRLKIDHQTTKSVREHFVIYADKCTGQQVWQWVRREQGKPLASRDHRFNIRQLGDPLIQRLAQIAVSLDEEEQITVVDVAGRARSAFDVDKITKRFYDRFKTEHAAFLNLVKGIKADADLQWYTSLMLNRLMFVYFIQKKGFLDGDTDYLRNRLRMVQRARGNDKFQSFYRYFLLRLFHDGLGKSPDERKLDSAMEKLLGEVPFLNGGFFEVHALEQHYPETDIPDKAFERLFDFFDQYQWHLDERPLRADNEINPDVVGYIFEKYVNQKQMGAYYTKEDITEYISKNTVIPFIFDAAKKKCAIAFNSGSALWRLLRDNPDRYIYPAVRHGVVDEEGNIIPLPKDIAAGIKDVGKRDEWNRPATDSFALPTETWREHVARRQRCLDIREKLRKGEVHQINDLITLTLDIWQLARDAIINAEGPELLRAFWHAIEKVTILDPTCGSGAFLFAALRILETLYSDCLERMEKFIEDLEGKPHHPEQYSDFKKVLAQIAKHPNERYFILKSIIINNLFGVDIMEEAVEICKLRLFLKLVAQVESVEQIEPLPDIDFNIRAGNTLVGYATADQARKAFTEERKSDMQVQSKLLMGEAEDGYRYFEESAQMVERAFKQFRTQQTTHGGKVTYNDKREIRNRLTKLDEELDRYLAGEYGINVKNQKEFDSWKASHQPFHWFVEFYGIMSGGGFDVIIGNPPYLEVTKLKNSYDIRGFETAKTGNLYALCSERSINLLCERSYISLIVPLSMFATPNMVPIQQFVKRKSDEIWVSYYSNRPDQLFEGAQNFLSIFIVRKSGAHQNPISCLHTTKLYRWASEERDKLFQLHSFVTIDSGLDLPGYAYPKFSNHLETSIARKIFSSGIRLSDLCRDTGPNRSWFVYCYGGVYWTKARNFDSPVLKDGVKAKSTADRSAYTISELNPLSAVCLLNSNLHFWFWANFSDCRNKTYSVILDIPVVRGRLIAAADLLELGRLLMLDYRANAERRVRDGKGGRTEFDEFYPKKSKPIIDEIDTVLAGYYGFTDEELDFIINYDIKYRMSGSNGEKED